jgi:uracil-DNA glycosylase
MIGAKGIGLRRRRRGPAEPSRRCEVAGSVARVGAQRRAALDQLETEVVTCRACPRLVAWRELVATERRAAFREEEYWGRPVPGFGDPEARLVIVGLAPAAHGANRTGRMFTGDRSGDFLFAALHRTGFANQPQSTSRDDGLRLTGAWITAPVRCAPPANKPTIEERDTCRPWLDRELALLDARVFLTLGAFGYQVLCGILGVRPRPAFTHGVQVDLPDGRSILGSYHVSQQNTFTGTLTEPMLDQVLLRAKQLIAT